MQLYTASLFIGFLWQSCLFCYLMHIVNQCTHKLAKLNHIQYGKTWIVKESAVKKNNSRGLSHKFKF